MFKGCSKQYWVQGIKNNKMQVVLKTNNLDKAINKLNGNGNLFIWDCLYRNMIKANYKCMIV